MGRSCRLARRSAPAIWAGNSNGTSGRVDVQNSSLSKLLGCNWNLEKSIATGTHNSEPLDHLERRAAHRPHLARDASRGHGGPAEEAVPKKKKPAEATGGDAAGRAPSPPAETAPSATNYPWPAR